MAAGESGIPVEDAEKYQRYAQYILVDIKILFIVTYVYISVTNLISTTANNEANQDIESPALFNVTSRPEHTDVIVEYIDDAVLWKCREHSLTSSYYIAMYWMLLAMLIATLLLYCVTKCFALWNIDNLESLTDLWHLGILELVKKNGKNYEKSKAEDAAKYIQDLLSKDIPKEDFHEELPSLYCKMKIEKIIPCVSPIVSVSLLVFCILSYDLHSLSCIKGVSEDFIDYDNTTQTVQLRFPETVINLQQAGVVIAFVLITVLAILALLFFWNTRIIISKMKEKARIKINRRSDVDLTG